MTAIPERSDALPTATSSDIKREGWRALVRLVSVKGFVAITANRRREVVVIETQAYDRLVDELTALRKATQPAVAELEAQFAKRIARMADPDVDARLRVLFTNPVDHQGRVRVGRGN